MEEIFEWNRVLFNDLPLKFLFEVVFRTTVMFIVLLVALKFTGKRGVKQLSIFETVLIIALGSAAGDPMFYEDVGLIPAIVVFVFVIVFYRLVTWLTGKSKWFETLLEGKTVCLIKEGRFSIVKFEKETLAQDEFFTELRQHSIEHLGQVRHAYLEPSGELSVFFYKDDEVRYGLPLLPEVFCKKSKQILSPGVYSCAFCGYTHEVGPGKATCPVCEREEWVESIRTIRTV
ncbi:MAG TPA: YetF domain-containing protein [Ohtaekwangia sp.]|nr:YetF domain-containing protein [Ohtaekwangia sp.]